MICVYNNRQNCPFISLTNGQFCLLRNVTNAPTFDTIMRCAAKPDHHPNIRIFKWNLADYSTSVKYIVEEVDNPTTTVYQETVSSKFAINFGFQNGQQVKNGLKFGIDYEDTKTVQVTKTITQGNDEPGQTVVSFADNVIVGSSNIPPWGQFYATNQFSTGYCFFSIEPTRSQ